MSLASFFRMKSQKSEVETMQNSPDSSGIILVEQIHEFALQG